jgi:ribonucleoside-diphosphate reductase alpha subunit
MRVTKRDSVLEAVSFDKVLQRIRKASKGLVVNPDALAQQVLARIVDRIKTSELDELTAQMAASLCTTHPDWGTLASRIAVSNHQKNTEAAFSKVVERLANQRGSTGEPMSYLSEELIAFVQEHGAALDAYIKHERDYEFDYFGFKTLEKAYLLRDTGRTVLERPQHMWMRVAVGIWGGADPSVALERVKETYDLLSQKFMTHATPTLFNAGSPRPQLSSCYLLAMADDSISGIYKTLGDCAAISKYAGGIGLHVHNVRARGSLIRGTNGTSNGLVPMLRVFNNTARYVDQCFVPETLIFTSSGSKRIQDIQPGDRVLTSGCIEEVDETGKHYVDSPHGAKFCEVIKRVEHNYTGKLFTVTMEHNSKKVSVTPKHPFLTKVGMNEYDYVEVENLHVGSELKYGTNERNSVIAAIEQNDVENIILYDLEINGTHDYLVQGMGFAHNGGGKRNGSFAIYLEPWHADVEDFLRLKLNSGSEEERARDLFYALWVPDLFMRRVEEDAEWSLFCPAEAPGLADVWGAEFDTLYTRYEREGRARKTVSARKLWFQVLDTQMETGTPYLLYKDAANGKSNQQNLGTIKSSNLCVEIMEYSSPEETAVCNLASIALPAFVTAASAGRVFDFEALRQVVRVATRNLNRVIDINFYPTPETRKSNMRHRPIGLGIQGLADVFAMLGLAWESAEAADLNQRIFEHMYFAALTESAAAAAVDGAYETFSGSPASKGLLQFDLWTSGSGSGNGATGGSGSAEGVPVKPLTEASLPWAELKAKIQSTGLRNSLLVAPMPTASTSQILGYNECFEPFTTNLYTRRTLAGEFIVVNKYLTKELMDLGLWGDEMKQRIVAANGSVQDIAEIPEAVRARFKTAWEIPQKVLIDMAAARGAFVCQSQSLNLFVPEPTYSKLTSMHFYAWKKGLKSGCYYLRTKAPVAAQKFTIDPRLLAAVNGPTGPAGPAGPSAAEQDDANSVVSDDSELTDDEGPVVVPAPVVQETRAQKLERLAREYEEEVARAKAAADAGEGCLYCSA